MNMDLSALFTIPIQSAPIPVKKFLEDEIEEEEVNFDQDE